MTRVVLDFETRSASDLKKEGPWKYAGDPSTQLLCCAYKIADEPTQLWFPGWTRPVLGLEWDGFPVFPKDAVFEAHNAEFERAIWAALTPFGLPLPPVNRWRCTAARAAVQSLPRSLEGAGAALGMPARKDKEGHALMLKMCKPRAPRKGENPADGPFWHFSKEMLLRLGEYCARDVDVEAGLSDVLFPLTPLEQRVWELDQTVNRRGVTVDLGAVQAIVDTLERSEEDLLCELDLLTQGAVQSPRQVDVCKAWIGENGGPALENFRKATISGALDEGELSPEIRRVLEIRQALSKASTAKFTAMLSRAEWDNRCRALFMYHAAGTGRWGGKAIQPQNMPRDCYDPETVDAAARVFETRNPAAVEILFGDPAHAASRCVRGVIVAGQGRTFLCADYASIEARANAWLAGQENVLADFRAGRDLYKVAASNIFGYAYELVTKPQRQVGKVSELALGYGGGIGAYASMALGYGVDLEALPGFVFPAATDDELESAQRMAKQYLGRNPGAMSLDAAAACDVIKQKWRAARPMIVRLWKELDLASRSAVEQPGSVYRYRGIRFVAAPDRAGNLFLRCRLPSGRDLFYPYPEIRQVEAPWLDDQGRKVHKPMLTFMGVDPKTKQWCRQRAPGFLLCENVIQAICRDVLAGAMLRAEAAGYPVVMHVHDEIVSEVEPEKADLDDFVRVLTELPAWAQGLPLGASGWAGRRYRKD